MPVRVWFSPQARGQAREAAIWWRTNRPAAPGLFAQELRKYVGLLSENPGLGRRYSNQTIPDLHRILLPDTKYHLYYAQVVAGELEIVAVWSAVKGRLPPLIR